MTPEEQTRERILLKAQELFLAHGYSKITMNEISEELGMSKKTLYKFFENKQDLLISVINTVIGAMERQLDALIEDQSMEFLDKLRTIMAIASAAQAGISNNALNDLRRNAPEAWTYVHNWRNEHMRTQFARFLDEGIKKGYIRTDLNKEIVVQIYTYGMMNIQQFSSNPALPYSMKEIFDNFIEIFYVGVFTDSARLSMKLQKAVINNVQPGIPGSIPNMPVQPTVMSDLGGPP
jgi:AcrR family transcriptional regulator